ncbi:MAG: alpha/beta hydrolase [Bacteroidota bacterium]
MKRYLPIFVLLIMAMTLVHCGETASKTAPTAQAEPTKPKTIEEGERLLDINGSKVFTKVVGKGEPVLVVHGGPSFHHGYLLPHFEDLAKSYQLIFYDQQGCGRSNFNSDTAKISIAGMVDDIEGLRKELGIEKLNLLGHSWGGLLAMNYAVSFPENLKRLLLISPTSGSSAMRKRDEDLMLQRDSKEDKARMQAVQQTKAFEDRLPSAYEEMYSIGFERQFFDKSLVSKLDLKLPDNFYRNSLILFRFMGPDLQYYNLHGDLDLVKVPVLLLYGDYESTALESRAVLKASFTNSEYVEIKDAGHFPFIEKPAEFLTVVKQFMAK